ncbi:hypothetical protein [Streptomyces sp. NBC_00233]|uniref:hypothetical protein n=1 Tax=Streptomyces sp. NBC_00233 TaxID=2975686 RepID=UPI00225463D8|nr:hypothetical protein [Streptomyces sp. NBC_00233]MCX5229691.1 hypothetical protein [Streptomyces sp. NBC_00233]
MNAALSLAGLALTIVILWANLRPWWTGSRDPKMLAPFGKGAGLGVLGTMCTGGLLGWLAGCAPQVGSAAGSKAVGSMTGTQTSTPLARGSLSGSLSEEGAIVVFLIAVGVVFAWRKASKDDKKRMAGGAFCGASLCATAGVAGALSFLPNLVNQAGDAGRAAFESAGVL